MNASTMAKISAGVAITEDEAAELDHDAALYGPGEDSGGYSDECNAAVWAAEQAAWDALGETDVLRRLGFDAPPEVLAARAEARARFVGAS